MLRILILIFCIFQELVINCSWAQGMTHISFARTRINGVQMLEEPTLPYNRLMDYFLENIKNIEMSHHYYPAARGYFLFEKQQVDCVFPGDPSNIASSFNTVVSETFNKVNAYLFSFADTTFNDKNIEGKRLALIRGYVYGNNQKILTHPNLTTVQNSTHAIGMLKLGRVDAFADYYLDLSLNLPAEEMAALSYDQENPIASVKDQILCHSTPQNIRFINKVNKVIREMKQDGRIKTILGNYYGYSSKAAY
jgi:hypothetical protein